MSNILLERSNIIKSLAISLGFDDVGIADASISLPYALELRLAKEENRFGPIDYLYESLEKRLDIRSFYPQAKSVVILMKNYYTGDFPKDIKDTKAKIARYAWGKDYHHWYRKKLKKFRLLLKEHIKEEHEIKTFNDTSPVLEKAWAERAGLGFIGKSSMFISRKLGTWTFIGGFVSSLELLADGQFEGPSCGTCTKCMDACPTKAIIAPKKLDARLCISTWTIERPLHPDAITKAPRAHNWGFGCDVCQEVCPWNKFAKISTEERFKPVVGHIYISKETFLKDLSGSPLNRAGKLGLMANYLRIRNSLMELNKRIY